MSSADIGLSWCRGVDLGLPRQPTARRATLTVHSCAARLAFSHLPLHRLLKAHLPILLAAAKTGPAAPETEQFFRENRTRVDVCVEHAALWLCNDGEASFGAPDVLQVCVLL